MADGRTNTIPLDQIKIGIDNLKTLGCQFIAFCGAECMTDFDKLPKSIQYVESLGIHTTVITSGVAKDFFKKLEILYQHGLRSLTMSYDIIPLDKHSKTKTALAMKGLDFFQKLGPIRDTAIIVTLTKTNYQYLLPTIEKMSKKNIWTFCDFIHTDRGQPGSKCKSVDPNLLFTDDDYPKLKEIMLKVIEMKKARYLCHSSLQFVDMVTRNDFELIKKYNWNCAEEPDFPAWVTLDCDGYVYCCDDFQPRDGKLFHITELVERWQEFSEYWKQIILDVCRPGCCWSHHIDAHLVKRGALDISDYVHGLKC